MTFFAPASRCFWICFLVLKIPVDSITISILFSFQGNLEGSGSLEILTSWFGENNLPSLILTSPSKFPITVSYFNKYAKALTSLKSLIATTLWLVLDVIIL